MGGSAEPPERGVRCKVPERWYCIQNRIPVFAPTHGRWSGALLRRRRIPAACSQGPSNAPLFYRTKIVAGDTRASQSHRRNAFFSPRNWERIVPQNSSAFWGTAERPEARFWRSFRMGTPKNADLARRRIVKPGIRFTRLDFSRCRAP